MIYLLARNYFEARWWWQHTEPPVNHKDVVVLTVPRDERKLFGMQFRKGDRIVEYHGGPRNSFPLHQRLTMIQLISPEKIEIEYVWSV